jgi:tRNA-2-methylthio-N6-dimethylallyladenosine synthase
MPKVYLETYGCQMNVADSELVLGLLARDGYAQTDDPASADVLLINTCAVRDHAEQRVIGRLGELKRHKGPGDVLGVMGCMAQRLGPNLLERVPQVDLVVGPDGYRSLGALVRRARDGERQADVSFKSWEHYEDVPAIRPEGASAFITVQRGCDYRCTFCIVPMTRGPERSRKLGDVVREVETLVAGGVTEVTLLGQTVNSYHDGDSDFADLLRATGSVPGLRRLRFTSPHPNDFSDRVVGAMAEVARVCEHVHLPMQSGSSRVLKRMLRRYTRDGYLECVERLRERVPGIALTTDIIVGFPGETEEDFLETCSMVEAVGFDDAYTFKYSPRDGTPATRIPDAVPDEVSGERLQRLIGIVRAVAKRKNLSLVGSTVEVLVEGYARRGDALQARSRTNKIVLIDGPAEWIGSYQTVRLTGTTGSTFGGEVDVVMDAQTHRRADAQTMDAPTHGRTDAQGAEPVPVARTLRVL